MKNQVDANLLKFIEAIERRKLLHLGPLTKREMQDNLLFELGEWMKEPCYECKFWQGCGTCPNGDNLKRYHKEIINIAVAAYYFMEYLGNFLSEKKAWEHTPW